IAASFGSVPRTETSTRRSSTTRLACRSSSPWKHSSSGTAATVDKRPGNAYGPATSIGQRQPSSDLPQTAKSERFGDAATKRNFDKDVSLKHCALDFRRMIKLTGQCQLAWPPKRGEWIMNGSKGNAAFNASELPEGRDAILSLNTAVRMLPLVQRVVDDILSS